ncbi:hypothetical protein HYX16_04125 [Candidatus Woesearchaeota archaeon]|nr:hypothetical protein [Candidatus Woesearchaeota archaeon]
MFSEYEDGKGFNIEAGDEFDLELSDLYRYHELERKVYYYGAKSHLYLIAATANNVLTIIEEEKHLLAARPDGLKHVIAPIDTNDFPNSVLLEEIVKDQEVYPGIESVRVTKITYELLLSALKIYEEIMKKNIGREENYEVIDVFKFGMEVLSGLIILSERGYVINRKISNSDLSMKNSEEAHLTAGQFLEKIREDKGWLFDSFFMPSYHGPQPKN